MRAESGKRRGDKLICNLKIDIYDLINCISQELTIRIDCHLQFGQGDRESGAEMEEDRERAKFALIIQFL